MSHPLNIWSFVGGVVGEFLEGFRWEFFFEGLSGFSWVFTRYLFHESFIMGSLKFFQVLWRGS